MISVVGSLVMDIAIRVPRLVQPGGVIHGGNLNVACGGRGANQASAVARMGGKPALIGIVGDDLFGDAMISALTANGVDTQAVVHRRGAASGCFVVASDPQGLTELIVANGINGMLSASDVVQHAKLITGSQAVLAQLETTFEAVDAALRIARESHVMTVLNAAPTFRFRGPLLSLCDVVTVNEKEAGEIAGGVVQNTESAVRAATTIRAMGARSVLVTLGATGVWVDSQEWRGHIPSYTVPIVDALGAGDTFVGTLTTRLCEGLDIRAAAEYAIAAAAISVTRLGAQASIPTRVEVDA
ncbi:MAG TPA: PfkB family carbohydrate kinase, partial [Anaerolineae bacterium]